MSLFGWLILGGAAALYFVSQQAVANTWPPSASVQSSLVSQLAASAQQQTGQALSPAQLAELTAAVAQAPTSYQATLPPGVAPTVAGYQAYVLSQGQLAIASGATLWQPGVTTSGYVGARAGHRKMIKTLPYHSPYRRVGGPLGLAGGDPYPTFDVHGNAVFVDAHGQPLVVYHENDPTGDYPPPPTKIYAGEVSWSSE